MKKSIVLALFLFAILKSVAQIETNDRPMLPMADTYQKPYKVGSIYYEKGTTKPFTGILYGKYENGNYLTKQEYVDGIGNGKWINFDSLGRKVAEGTYKDNRVEGPIKFFYENGNLKSEGQYLHWKRPIGIWTYYDEKGNVVRTENYSK